MFSRSQITGLFTAVVFGNLGIWLVLGVGFKLSSGWWHLGWTAFCCFLLALAGLQDIGVRVPRRDKGRADLTVPAGRVELEVAHVEPDPVPPAGPPGLDEIVVQPKVTGQRLRNALFGILLRHHKGLPVSRRECEAVGISQTDWNLANAVLKRLGLRGDGQRYFLSTGSLAGDVSRVAGHVRVVDDRVWVRQGDVWAELGHA